MADIFNRSPSHTEENNKQQATSFCQSSHTQSTAKGSFLFMPLQLYDVRAHCNPALQLIQNLLHISSKVHLFPTEQHGGYISKRHVRDRSCFSPALQCSWALENAHTTHRLCTELFQGRQTLQIMQIIFQICKLYKCRTNKDDPVSWRPVQRLELCTGLSPSINRHPYRGFTWVSGGVLLGGSGYFHYSNQVFLNTMLVRRLETLASRY